MSPKKRPKKPTRNKFPKTDKIPRVREQVHRIGEMYISWHLRILDTDGNWSWKDIDKETVWKEIHSKLSEIERKTWNEILVKEKTRNHTVPISEICIEAQNRLRKIRQHDIDNLISLRLSGKKRVWGIRAESIFKILWWDPNHTVCPVYKKHT